jgi:hypothetical protein
MKRRSSQKPSLVHSEHSNISSHYHFMTMRLNATSSLPKIPAETNNRHCAGKLTIYLCFDQSNERSTFTGHASNGIQQQPSGVVRSTLLSRTFKSSGIVPTFLKFLFDIQNPAPSFSLKIHLKNDINDRSI